MSVEDVEGKGVMQKIIGARECSKIGSFGVDAKEKGWREWRSKAVHSRKNQKAQQKRGLVERKSGEPSKC